ncbi:unnamed protein product [Withania somnifera]
MASQSTIAAETVAHSFVDQYYHILQKLIGQSYRFYKERSVLSWPLSDGKIKSVTTSEGINEFINSSHFKNNKVEITSVDSQSSAAGGILVMVTACLVGQDESRKETGYYVLNDILRFVGVEQSATVVEEKIVENESVIPLAENTVDQVGEKPSIISSQKEKQVAEMTSIIENEAPKVTYASVGRSSVPTNAPHKIVRVATNVGLPSTPKKTQHNSFIQALTSSLSSVSKVANPTTNVAQDNYDDIQYKSIYIGGLPPNTTRSDLHAVVKEFGPVYAHDVQLKTYEDGFCCGFVHFQDAISARNAVQTHHIIVKGKEAYITFKRLDKDRGERTKSPLNRSGFGRGSSESKANIKGLMDAG